eukprot:TRINITY_DN9539_c0_g1_i1.p1 TRINITY_DN9539_c0_g1~~TRINITY_DN9539_c0_g1_i1.p1  ORF type:complete len:141 (-),score=30.15 TRINITY_DN9539_c0_g1_i1:196-618(-)
MDYPRRHRERLSLAGWAATLLLGALMMWWGVARDLAISVAGEIDSEKGMIAAMHNELSKVLPNPEWTRLLPAYLCVTVVFVVVFHAAWVCFSLPSLHSTTLYKDSRSIQKYKSNDISRSATRVPLIEDVPVEQSTDVLFS